VAEKTVRTSFDIPIALHRRLHEAAARGGCSARQIILRSIESAVRDAKPQRPKRRLNLAKPIVASTGRPFTLSRTNRFMTSLSFPDVNVWLAVLLADHMHRASARKWWESDASAIIAFSRFTQIGVLRLLTTAAAMSGKPLTLSAAWHACDPV